MQILNGRVFIDGNFVNADLKVENGLFTAIAPTGGLTPEGDTDILDCSGLKILPGLFDIHTHGCLGHDFSRSTAGDDLAMCRFYAAHGVTSILATTMTSPLEQYRQACREIRAAMQRQEDYVQQADSVSATDPTASSDRRPESAPQARIRGINMEGPFLSASKKGAHDPRYLYPVTDELFTELNSLSGDAIKVLTIAPELPGAMDFIKNHAAAGADGHIICDPAHQVISVGHSDCDYDTAMTAFSLGANHVTHLYNAMRDPAHRAPGIVGAAADSSAFVELICDGLHVHESIIRNAFRSNPGRVVMISDSISPTGLPDGPYTAGGMDVQMINGEIRLANGTLAGSSITLFDALARCITRFGIPEVEAINAATLNPARSLGLENCCGVIATGRQADFIVVDDTYRLHRSVVGGVGIGPTF